MNCINENRNDLTGVTRSSMPVVFLLNPISGEGHLDAYARLYSAAILKLGYRVVLIADQDAGCPHWLAERGIATDHFSIVTSRSAYTAAPSDKRRLLSKAVDICRQQGVRSLMRRSLTYFKYKLCHPFFRIKRKVGILLDHYPAIKARISAMIGWTITVNNEIPVSVIFQRIRWAEKTSGLKPDLVFILYSDMLEKTSRAWTRWLYPWACIRFVPSIGPWSANDTLEGFFMAATFCGACLLDEESTEIYQTKCPQGHFVTVPDICDPELCVDRSELVERLRSRANGRKIVFTGGGLTGRKGLGDLVKVIDSADAARFFFVIVGKVYWTTFSQHDADALRVLFSAPQENVMAYTRFIEDEREFNAIMAASDIIYAVYRDFPHSSNMLSKAAHFERPLLVSDRYLMGKNVKHYRLGLTVREGDVDGIVEKLEALRDFDVTVGARIYRKAHSIEVLEHVLDDFLTQCVKISRRRTKTVFV